MKAQDLFQVAAGSPVAHAMLELAASLMPQIELPPPPETFISRLKSAFGPH
jgi:hypothetical protein